MRYLATLCAFLSLSACTGIPDGIHPVGEFDLNRYLGKWYEIARLDHSFEKGLERVSAEYSLRGDGGVKVVNRGYSTEDKTWKEVEGKAYFVRGANEGYLKVSFFGPFYGSYVIFGLDKKTYSYAFVTGYDKSYLWLLSRTPTVDDSLVEKFTREARELGFDIAELIMVEQP